VDCKKARKGRELRRLQEILKGGVRGGRKKSEVVLPDIRKQRTIHASAKKKQSPDTRLTSSRPCERETAKR